MREKILIDDDWKFHFGEIYGYPNDYAWSKSGSFMQGPCSTDFDDTGWRTVNLPHDFVIETEMTADFKHDLGVENAIPLMEEVGNLHTTSGSFEKGVGWYRKHFYIPQSDEGKKIYLIFDGVFRDSKVYLNDFFAGSHISGYTGAKYDISDLVNYGGDNLLSVKCDSTTSEGWFYEGGGIYRHAYILKTDVSHIEDAFCDYTVDIENKTAHINIKTEIENPDGTELKVTISDANKNTVSASAECDLENITLWDISSPYLYTAKCELYRNDEKIDEYSIKFGLRKIEFTADKGFFLNGKNIKLKGVCCHHHHGGLGTALPDEMHRYRIEKLLEMGANAYRCAHYPPTQEFLNVCDELGMLVMDETRLLSSAPDDLEQLRFMVRGARNHPSVILYSIGNEEAQTQITKQGGRIARTMINEIRKLDATRPATMALLMFDLKNRRPIDDAKTLSAVSEQLDVAGFNYHEDKWELFHNAYPNQPMICTEQSTFKYTRGIYDTDDEICHLAMLQKSAKDKSQSPVMEPAKKWKKCHNTDYMSGMFIWTGFDYYGEPSPYAWPAISSQFGAMDLCGFRKDFFYYYKAWWSEDTVIHICSHWNFKDGDKRDICVFSNCDEAELFVNGKSYGRQKIEPDGYLIYADVAFEAGEIKAVGYNGGKAQKEDIVKTADTPYSVKITVDYRENDLTVINAAVIDKNGLVVPYADNWLEFEVSNGRILGTSNGDPQDHTAPTGAKRRAFSGLCQAIVKCPDGTTITVNGEDIINDTVTV